MIFSTQDHCGKSGTANGTFRVITENIPCGNTGTTCSKSIKVFLEVRSFCIQTTFVLCLFRTQEKPRYPFLQGSQKNILKSKSTCKLSLNQIQVKCLVELPSSLSFPFPTLSYTTVGQTTGLQKNCLQQKFSLSCQKIILFCAMQLLHDCQNTLFFDLRHLKYLFTTVP